MHTAHSWAPYQRRFFKAVDDPTWRTVAASWPRGAGKTTAAGFVVSRALTPGDPLFVPGGEIVLFSGSIEQTRLVFPASARLLGAAPRRVSAGRLGNQSRDHTPGIPHAVEGCRQQSQDEPRLGGGAARDHR